MSSAEDRGLHTYVGSMFDGTVCADAAELATAYGAPVFEPASWPVRVEKVHYTLSAQPPSPPFGPLPPSYYIFVTSPDRVRAPVVWGFAQPPSVVEAEGGWYAHPELADVNGLACEEADTAQVVLRRDGQTVQLGPFAAIADAVATARSLRRVEPRA